MSLADDLQAACQDCDGLSLRFLDLNCAVDSREKHEMGVIYRRCIASILIINVFY